MHAHTYAHTVCWQFNMKCLNVPNKRPAGEQKEMWNKKQTSNEIITIQRERVRGAGATMAGNNRAASMEKKVCAEKGG